VQPQASTIPFPHPPLPLSQQRQLLQLQQLTLLPKHLVPVLHLDQLSPAARHLRLNGYFFYHCLPSSFDLKKLTTVLSASLKSCSSNEIAIYGGKAVFGLWLLLMWKWNDFRGGNTLFEILFLKLNFGLLWRDQCCGCWACLPGQRALQRSLAGLWNW